MGLNPFAGIAARRAEQRNTSDGSDALMNAFIYGGNSSASGVRVTPETALASVAVAACVEIRAETSSALPGMVFEKQGRYRVPQPDNVVEKLLFDTPNDLMHSGELLRWKQIRRDTTGNAGIRIEWLRGRPVALWPMYAANPEPKVAKGSLAYEYEGDEFTPKGAYSPKDILFFKGPFLKTPFKAASPIDMIRDTIGLSIATEQFFGRFLSNGSHFPSFLETDSVLTDADMKAVGKSLGTTAGIFDAGKTRIFDRGLKLKSNPMSLKDADLTAQMRWYLEQICRIYRMPLPMVQDWTHGTYTNSEQAGLWFSQHTITPILVDDERVVRKLFVKGEENFRAKWNVDAVLRGDYATRTAGYSTLILAGVMAPNEARALEDMDPYEGGDDFRLPLNTAPVGAELAQEAPAAASNKVKAEEVAPPVVEAEPRAMLAPFLDDALDRVAIRARQDAGRGRAPDATATWASETVMPPVVRAFNLAGIPLDLDDVLAVAIADALAAA